MLSINFGNSYTKVAIRPGLASRSKTLGDATLAWDDQLNICIPTIAAKKNDRWYFGTDVLQLNTSRERLHVVRNWKPEFFRGGRQPQSSRDGQNGRTRSAGTLVVTKAELQPQYHEYLTRALSNPATFDATKILAFDPWLEQYSPDDTGLVAETTPAGELTDLEFKEIAHGFFEWLRGFIVPLVKNLGIADVAEMPTRIMLPSFGSHTAAEALLVEILKETGWTADDVYPALPEPLANTIGIFTEGRNAILTPSPRERYPNYREMFSNSPFYTAMREAALAGGDPVYWAMVVDLGGYTSDFGMIGFDLENFDFDHLDLMLAGQHDGRKMLATFSEPLGVQLLDARVRESLAPSKRQAIDVFIDDPDQLRLEGFHRNVYQLGRAYKSQGLTIGEGDDKELVDDCLDEFANEIADRAQKFLEIHQYEQFHELVLTGGGCNIPAVREALYRKLSPHNVKWTYMPADEEEQLPGGCRRLDPLYVRGATALGGSSLFFDKL